MSLHLGNSVVYKVHPLVILSILDHCKRREVQGNVVGTLLGEKKGNTVHITNSFPVPIHVINELKAHVDKGYHDKMLQLYKQINHEEVVVGWYSTGEKITYISSIVHQEMYSAEVTDVPPVLLTVEVDALLRNHRMGIKAYTAKTIKVGDKDAVTRFQRAPLEYFAHEAEKIGVEAMINSHPEEKNNRMDAPATLMSDLESLDQSLTKVSDMVGLLAKHASRVAEGKEKGRADIGRAIAEAVAAVPHLESARFKKMFNGTIQDLLMAVYLANLTRTQVALADKITGLVQ